MRQTQVQLTEEQALVLEELGRELHVSRAELVRRAVDLLLADETTGRGLAKRRQRALTIAGSFRSGGKDAARRHDEALADAFAEKEPKSGRRVEERG